MGVSTMSIRYFCKSRIVSDLQFDFVVVGAGIVGSWTAKELKKHGKVLLLEQFREPHTRGSSHGQSRLIRSGYDESFFADLMPPSFKMWRQAENETKEELIKTTGTIYIADSPLNKRFISVIENFKRLSPEYLMEMSGRHIKSKYSTTLSFDENCGFLFDKSGGVIYAHKAVRTIQQWFQKSGGIMWDSCKVTDIKPGNDKVKVITSRGDVYAKSLVVTSGCWSKQLVNSLAPSLPLEPQAVKVYYWKEKKPGIYSPSSGFPTVLDLMAPYIYALPSIEYPGLVKICWHGGVPCDPDERDKAKVDVEKENYLKDYIKKHFPLLEAEPAIVETCMYTCTPDEIFLIDQIPGFKNIVIGTGFSGTGFKMSPAVGRLLNELARGVEPFLDISPYRISRFTQPK